MQDKLTEIDKTKIINKRVLHRLLIEQTKNSNKHNIKQSLLIGNLTNYKNIPTKLQLQIDRNINTKQSSHSDRNGQICQKKNTQVQRIMKKRELLPHTQDKNNDNNNYYQYRQKILANNKSGLIQNQNSKQKGLRHRKNFSAVWAAKKKQKSKLLFDTQQSDLAKFCLQRGEKPTQYELKMQIKTIAPRLKNSMEELRPKLTKSKFYYQKCVRKVSNISQNQQRNPWNNQQSGKVVKKNSLNLEPSHLQRDQSSSHALIEFQIKHKTADNLLQRYLGDDPSRSQRFTDWKKRFHKRQKQEQQKMYHITNILQSKQRQTNQEQICVLSPKFTRKFNQCHEPSFQHIPNSLSQLTTRCASTLLVDIPNSTCTPMFQKNEGHRVEIASLTKIMTCFLVINISEMFRIELTVQKLAIPFNASKTPGTSAKLEYSDILSVKQALYGLMLPSGNDAAIALAHWGGKTIRKYCDVAQKIIKQQGRDNKSNNFINQITNERKSYQKLFILHMNKISKSLKLKDTHFMNPHGLMNSKSYSTAFDMAKLTAVAMKSKQFRQIVQCKQYKCKIYNRTYSQVRQVTWKNSNKLLQFDGYLGGKTGITSSAGPCLCSIYKLDEQRQVISVVLSVKTMQQRFRQSLTILKECLLVIDESKLIQLQRSVANCQKRVNQGTYNEQEQQQANLIIQKQVNSELDQDDEEDDSDI